MKKNLKYIVLGLATVGLVACNEEYEVFAPEAAAELSAGSADFSTYVAVGNSLTAGYTDGALFAASQQNSFTNILATNFSLVGGGEFKQPLMSDNIGGMLLGETQITANRLVFNGSGPARLETVIGPVMPSTNLATNNPAGPFNNMGVPGAKSYHLLAPGYGNVQGLLTQPATANPYYVRMASAADATVLGDAMAQNATFFSLWIGNNDVLGYATTGGDGSDPITSQGLFDQAYGAIVAGLTANGAKGVVANIPYVTSIPFFTTVPYNAIPLDAATAEAVNAGYAAYNGGLAQIQAMGAISADELAARVVMFNPGQNAPVIEDESLTDLSGFGLPSYRHAKEDDLLVLTSATFLGTTVGGNPLLVNGISVPLADKWVLIPAEQAEINDAVDGFNATIQATATAAGLAFVDANATLSKLALNGLESGAFKLRANLVTGGVFSLDGVHSTARGYAFISNEFLKAIDATYGSNFAASGNLNDIGDFPTNYSPLLQ
jgi:hypothetical protein